MQRGVEFGLRKCGSIANCDLASSRPGMCLKKSLFRLPREKRDESHSCIILLFFFQVSISTVGRDCEGVICIWGGRKGMWATERKRWKHVIVFIYTPVPPQKQPLGKRRKYLGTFKQNGPSDLNLCFQVNSISKLSIRGCLEEFGPLKAARSEAVGKLLSWRGWLPPKTGKWRSIALSFNRATNKNDNTCLSNLFPNVNLGRE